VIGQISIDQAKKEFDIDCESEINRIKRLPCMKRKEIPQFFAENKKQRSNKNFDNQTVIRRMNCPMDIMAEIIERDVIDRAEGKEHIPVYQFLNRDITGKANRYKKEKTIAAIEGYLTSCKWIEEHKDRMDKSTVLSLKNHAMKQLLYRTSSELDQETVMELVKYAFNNTSMRSVILNFLFGNEKEHSHRDKFMNCFVHDKQKYKN
jgi:hypothetical protein